MFMFMSIGISYAETVHSQNAAMEFRFQDVTIEKALKEIEKKTGYNFFYNTKDFNVKRKISFSAKGMNLSEVLNGIFAEFSGGLCDKWHRYRVEAERRSK